MCIIMVAKRKLGLVLTLLLLSVTWLVLLVYWSPLPSNSALRFPSSLEDIRGLADTLHEYRYEHHLYVMTLFISAYLFKQSFAIPGSVLMNVLGGAVFGLPLGFPLCSLLTAAGASVCYGLARYCGPSLAQKYFPNQFSRIRQKLVTEEHHLGYYLLFLRLFPISPNWAINMACGALSVSLPMFFVTAFVGLMPYNYVCVQAGAILSEIHSMSDVYKTSTLLQLSAMAAVALLPIMCKKRLRQRI